MASVGVAGLCRQKYVRCDGVVDGVFFLIYNDYTDNFLCSRR